MPTRILRFVAALIAFAGFAAPIHAREVAITVDDLPWVEFALSTQAQATERSHRLVAALRGTHATAFVNEDKLYADDVLQPWRRDLLEDWLRAGLDLGNHTYGHVSLHDAGLEKYTDAIAHGETILRPLLAQHDRKLRWFRHPFLQTGRDDAVRAGLAAYLADHHYRVAPVSVDTSDWVYARAYVEALNRNDTALIARLRHDYPAYIEAKFAYYEHESRALLGREPSQVLLLHANALNADCMPDILARLRKRGYRFIDLDLALADPAYARPDGYYGRGGISWVHRWAMAEHRPKEFYAGEPAVPADILALAHVDSE